MSEIDFKEITNEISKIILGEKMEVAKTRKDSASAWIGYKTYLNGYKDACDNILSDILKYLTERSYEENKPTAERRRSDERD
jgi:hypothetical protein